MALFIQCIQDGGAVFFDFNYMFVADGEELNDLSEHATAAGVDEARNYFIGDVSSGSAKHFLQLGGRKALDNHVLLRLFCLVLLLKLERVVLVSVLRRVDLWEVGVHIFLSQVDVLQQTLPPLLHFNQSALQSLPELVVRGPAYITCVPHIVLNELFDLVFPLGLQHHFFDRLNRDHQSMYVFDQHIVSRDQQLLPSARASTLQIGC